MREARFSVARCAVAHRLAGRHVAHLQDAPGELAPPAQSDCRPGPAGPAAIERDAGTDEVIMIGLPKQNAGGIGEARRSLRQLRAKPVEGFSLRLVLRMLGLVGAGEMAHHQRKLEGAQQDLRARKRRNLVGREAEPVHAAVDMDGSGKLRARRRTERRPFFDLVGAVEHRAQDRARDRHRPYPASVRRTHRSSRRQGARAARPLHRAWRRRRSCSRPAPEPERFRAMPSP